jgi:hypothetical protein
MAERQSRAVPAARMMVNASTASTRHARNTAMNSAEPLTGDPLTGLSATNGRSTPKNEL